jgi:hypothetical protein
MNRSAGRLVPLAIATMGVVAQVACGRSESADPTDSSLLSVSGTEYSFDAPEAIADGPTKLRFTNEGEEDHEIHLLRLNDGVAIHQFQQTLHQDGLDAALRLGEVKGHVASVPPGETSVAAVDLLEGEYVLICQLPSPGNGDAHALNGMAKPLTVRAR